MDFSAWDWANFFRLHEAACLIAGVMPISKKLATSEELPPQARPVLVTLGSAYYEWFFQNQNPARQKVVVLEGLLNDDGTLPPFPVPTVLSGVLVSRGALHSYITTTGRKSAYNFGPTDSAQATAQHSEPAAVEVSPAQEQTSAPPAESDSTPAVGPVTDSASNAPAWTVTKPERFGGYAAPLYRLLAAAHREGRPCPAARDVLEAWRINTPAEISKVLPDGFDYYDAKGNTKPASLDAIRKAIDRMTSAR